MFIHNFARYSLRFQVFFFFYSICWQQRHLSVVVFMQAVESKCSTRSCCKLPLSFGPPPSASLDEIGGWGDIPSLEQLGLEEKKAGQ